MPVKESSVLNLSVGERAEEFQLFGKAEHRPGQPTRPGAEGRIALLAVGAAVFAIVDVEQAFVRDTAGNIVSIAVLAVIDRVRGSGLGIAEHTPQQTNPLILFALEDVAQSVGDRQ